MGLFCGVTRNTLLTIDTHNAQMYAATHCNALQHTATYCNRVIATHNAEMYVYMTPVGHVETHGSHRNSPQKTREMWNTP